MIASRSVTSRQIQDTLPPGNSSDTFDTIRTGISSDLVDELHICTGIVNLGFIEMLKQLCKGSISRWP